MSSGLSTDLYQISMMAGYYLAGLSGRSSFELFVRELPPGRGFLIAAGLDQALEWLEGVRFSDEEVQYLRSVPALATVPSPFFDEYLPRFRFTGDVWAVGEGEPVFAQEPILRVTGPAAEAQLVETALLAIVTFQTSIASKAARIVQAAQGKSVIEFGSRRAHGLEAARHAARAACLAGCEATSNVEAGARYGLPVSGTMAHSWVMSFEHEADAFRQYLTLFGAGTTLLIDTYDTVAAAELIVREGLRPAAVRLDSGDLDALSRQVRAVLDAGGLQATRIIASSDLDEHAVARLVRAGAPIDGFGVGTALSTSKDAPALGGVYKLVEIERGGAMRPVVKLSSGKRTAPGSKQVWRRVDGGYAAGDVVALDGETGQSGRPLLGPVMQAGRRLSPSPPLADLRRRCLAAVAELPAGVRRLSGWDAYPVRLSDALERLSQDLARSHARA